MYVRRLRFTCAALCAALVAMVAFACTALASLPDNRAYEMVSPIEKGGAIDMTNLALASSNGEHVIVDGGVANSLLSNAASWMAETRTQSGWKGVQVGPPPRAETTAGNGANYIEQRETSLAAVSEDFSRFAFQAMISLDPRDVGTSSDVYVRNGATGLFSWASGPPAPTVKEEMPPVGCGFPLFCIGDSVQFAGASADLSDVVWGQFAPVLAPPASLPGSPPDTHAHGYEVYQSDTGVDQLVGVVPSGGETECDPAHGSCVVPPCGAAMGNETYSGKYQGEGFAPSMGEVSPDGSRVIFTSPDPQTETIAGCVPAEIYVREDGTRTVEVSASQRPGGDPNGTRPKVYVGSAEENGRISAVLFTSREELTQNSNTGSTDQGNDLYAYSLTTSRLTDLTPDENGQDANGANVLGFIGSSADGSLVYFTASGVLAPGAKENQSNLYVYDTANGQTTFIAPGSEISGPTPGVGSQGSYQGNNLTAEVTPDGQHLVFVSREQLTSYDNNGPDCLVFRSFPLAGACAEVYLYTASDNRVVCVSCDPDGKPPTGSAKLTTRQFPEGYGFFGNPGTLPRPRVVSDDGSRVFFDSPDQLTTEAPSPSISHAVGILVQEGELEPNLYEYEEGHVYLVAPDAGILLNDAEW